MATIHSFFLPDHPLEIGQNTAITKAQYTELFHQLHTVFRCRKGMEIYLLDNKGKRALCEIHEVTKKDIIITIKEVQSSKEPTANKKLWLPIMKPAYVETVVRMSTEIGITRFQFFESEHSNKIYKEKLLSQNTQRRLQAIITEAAEQSEKYFLPVFEQEVIFLDRIVIKKDLLVLIERSPLESDTNVQNLSTCSEVLIGPEGGFSSKEKEYLLSTESTKVSFPDTILKAETAAVIGSSLICLK